MGEDLVTLAEYKAHVNKTNPGDDALLSQLITMVSSFVKSYCRRTFIDYITATKTDIFNGGSNFVPSEYPLTNVSLVEYSQDFGQTYTTLVLYTDYIVDIPNDEVMFLTSPYNFTPDQYYGSAGSIPTSTNNVLPRPNAFRITYNAGFDPLPEDIKLAVFDLVTYYFRNDGAVHSNRNPGSNTIQTEYINISKMPGYISRILDLYRANYA